MQESVNVHRTGGTPCIRIVFGLEFCCRSEDDELVRSLLAAFEEGLARRRMEFEDHCC